MGEPQQDVKKSVKYRGVDYKVVKGKVNINNNFYTVISEVNNQGDLEEKCFFDCNIRIDSSNIEILVSKNKEGQDELSLRYSIVNGDFIVTNQVRPKSARNGMTEKYEESYEKLEKPLFLSFTEVIFEKNTEIIIGSKESQYLYFKECFFGQKLKIRNTEYILIVENHPKRKSVEYKKNQENKLPIEVLEMTNCTAGESAYLRIGFLKEGEFKLSNLRLPQNAEFNIGDCHFKTFRLRNFRNIGKFKLYKVNILEGESGELFQIDNTSIGQTDFQSVNLAGFTKVRLFDNIFTELDYSNVQWKKNVEVGRHKPPKYFVKNQNFSKNIAKHCFLWCLDKKKKQQDTYRTLKNVAQRNNDQPQALVFYVQEMEKYREIVKGNAEYPLSDRATLWFNYHTNDFGLNFWKPIVWLVGLAGLFYALLLLSLTGGNYFSSENIGPFFEFLIPLHKTEFIAEDCWNTSTYALDFVFRLIEGLLIYQTIIAFRKYSRKL